MAWGSTPLVLVLSYCIPVRRVYQLVLYHLARSNSKHVSYLIPVSVLYKWMYFRGCGSGSTSTSARVIACLMGNLGIQHWPQLPTPTAPLCLCYGGSLALSPGSCTLTVFPPLYPVTFLDIWDRFILVPSLHSATERSRTTKRVMLLSRMPSILAIIRSFCLLSRSSLASLTFPDDLSPPTFHDRPT